jgi:hypothetical protein
MFDRDALLRHYRQMSDEQFTYFATHEAYGLTPEALALVREELRRRATVPDPDAAIGVQVRSVSSAEFERMLARFREQPCPLCGATGSLLNAVVVTRGRRGAETVVGCVPCLDGALLANQEQRKLLERPEATPALRQYVWDNRGEWIHLAKEG